jgi:hypothetical protein
MSRERTSAVLVRNFSTSMCLITVTTGENRNPTNNISNMNQRSVVHAALGLNMSVNVTGVRGFSGVNISLGHYYSLPTDICK